MAFHATGQQPGVPTAVQVLVLSAATALGCYLLALSLPASHTWLLLPFTVGTGVLIGLVGTPERIWLRTLSAVLLAACVLAAVLISSTALFSWSLVPLVFVHLPAGVAHWSRQHKATAHPGGASRR